MIRAHWYSEIGTDTRVLVAEYPAVDDIFSAQCAVRYPSGRTYAVPASHLELYFKLDKDAPESVEQLYKHPSMSFAYYTEKGTDVPAVLIPLYHWEPYEHQLVVLKHGDVFSMPHYAALHRFTICTPQEVILRSAFGNVDDRPTPKQREALLEHSKGVVS
jgi:hypothetical protein